MRRFLATTILLVLAIGDTGLSWGGPRPGGELPGFEIRDYTARYYFLGGWVLPPQGSGWRSQRVGENAIDFGRSDSPQHTWAATVTPFYVDSTMSRDDLSELARLRAKEGQGRPVTLRSFEAIPDSTLAPLAVRYHYQIEDRKVPYDKGTLYILDARGLVFVHPQVPHLVTVVEFSERVESSIPLAADAKADSFLAKVNLLHFDATGLRRVDVNGGAYVLRADKGALWAVTLPHVDGLKCEVLRLDPANMEIKARVQVDGRISDLAVTSDALWACDFEKGVLLRLDPVSLATTASVKTGGHPERLFAGFGAIWVSDRQQGTVQCINLASLKPDGKPLHDLKQPLTMLQAGEVMWILDQETRRVMSFDPRTRKLTGRAIPADAGAGAMVFAEGSIWVLCGTPGKIMRLDPVDLTIPASIPLGFNLNTAKPTLMTFGSGTLWVGDLNTGRLFRIDTSANQVSSTSVSVGLDVSGMTVGEGVVWVGDGISGTIVEMPLD